MTPTPDTHSLQHTQTCTSKRSGCVCQVHTLGLEFDPQVYQLLYPSTAKPSPPKKEKMLQVKTWNTAKNILQASGDTRL